MKTNGVLTKLPLYAACLFILFGTAAAVPSPLDHQPFRSTLEQKLAPLAGIVSKSIKAGETPGAVVLIGHKGKIVYRRAFGQRSLSPVKTSMTEDVIFDLASLTKPIATATAVMQLAETGALHIDDPVYKYWPEFGSLGKKRITIRQLLTHYSGLRPDLKMRPPWHGYETAMRKIIAQRPIANPGRRYIYSDINFEVLGELVRRVSGLPLDVYCERYVFIPLGMKDTSFNPSPDLRGRIAPTEYIHRRLRCGSPADPSCSRMGGVAGHAGLFSTADDLAVFAQMILNGGGLNGTRVLNEQTVLMMTTSQSPPGGERQRGLGWDIEPSFISDSSGYRPITAYGHLGYTGTALWIDPGTQTYVIVLTSRLHPYGRGDVRELREEVKEVVSQALEPFPSENLAAAPAVLTGIDMLEQEGFSPLAGKRVGLITNQTGRDAEGRRTIDVLYGAPNVKLTAIFSPEHGLFGKENTKVSTVTEPVTGLPVYSLYGDVTRPTEDMLDGLDAVVFDIQDVGTRFFTYITTMGYAMEAAAKKGIAFYVLDRPNPINASLVQGPIMDENLKSFTGYFPLPIRHGMTVGELARMFNSEGGIGADLHIVPMGRYRRAAWYDGTGLPWVSPSPNLRSLTEAILYPGVALVEGANISVGRGTDTPFEVLGAPWITGKKLADYLNDLGLAGVKFAPTGFTPDSDRYKGEVCHGVKITLLDRRSLNAAALGTALVDALYRLYPGEFTIDKTLLLVGSKNVLDAIKNGNDPRSLHALWKPSLEKFLALRARYLLY